MPWSIRRKILYISVVSVVVLIFVVWIGASIISKPATCFDTLKNQGEEGIDCGGPCSLLCKAATHEPIVTWARSFEVASSTYTAAAYIENPNTRSFAAAKNVRYAFRLFDADNKLIKEVGGTMDILPTRYTPIISTSIDVGTRIVAHTFLEFSDDIIWNAVSTTSWPQLYSTSLVIAPDGNRVDAILHSNTDKLISNIPVIAILYDVQGNAQAASRTIIDAIPARGSSSVVFTWPTANPNIVRAELVPIFSLPVQ